MKHYQLKITTNDINNFTFVEKLIKQPFKKIYLPKQIKQFVFIKSPHVNSSSKEHFKLSKYCRLYYAHFSTSSLGFFLTNLPNNLQVRIKNLTN
jgi:ribosomal protein S10